MTSPFGQLPSTRVSELGQPGRSDVDSRERRRYAELMKSDVASVERATGGVPFLDLWPSHEALREPILAEIADLIEAGSFTGGRKVAAFEEAYAAYCGTLHCVGVASGLDALRLSLLAAGLTPGD